MPSATHDAIITQLTALGLTSNEALAYLTLLEAADPEGLTGYELATRSGIPRSAAYNVLRRLESNGGAILLGASPTRYAPTAPEAFIEHLRRGTDQRLSEAARALASLPPRPHPEPVWILSRYEEVMQRAEAMIRGAKQSVALSVWPREARRLAPAFEAIARSRRLHRVMHSPAPFEAAPPGFSLWAEAPADDDPAKATWSHKILVVVDRREALIGGTEPDADNHAVHTTNPSLVDLAINHIVLDITLMARARQASCEGDVAPLMRPHLGKG